MKHHWAAPAAAGCASALCAWGAISSSGWEVFWLLVGTIGFAAESFALWRPAKGDTLSETVWDKTKPLTRRIPMGIFLVWLTLHFVFRLGA